VCLNQKIYNNQNDTRQSAILGYSFLHSITMDCYIWKTKQILTDYSTLHSVTMEYFIWKAKNILPDYSPLHFITIEVHQHTTEIIFTRLLNFALHHYGAIHLRNKRIVLLL